MDSDSQGSISLRHQLRLGKGRVDPMPWLRELHSCRLLHESRCYHKLQRSGDRDSGVSARACFMWHTPVMSMSRKSSARIKVRLKLEWRGKCPRIVTTPAFFHEVNEMKGKESSKKTSATIPTFGLCCEVEPSGRCDSCRSIQMEANSLKSDLHL